jgi:hypothetical protein
VTRGKVPACMVGRDLELGEVFRHWISEVKFQWGSESFYEIDAVKNRR